MSLEKRIEALETSSGEGGECPECGNGPDDRPPSIVFVDPDDVRPHEWCETCGRALHITIHMDW